MLQANVTNSSSPVASSTAALAPFMPGNCPTASSFLPVMVSLASLFGCLYVIATYCYVPALRQHPAGIMFGMSVYCAIYQFLFLMDRASGKEECSKVAIFIDFFLTGQETYMLIFAIDLLLALKNPFSASKGQMNKYHVFGGLWSLLFAILSHFDTHHALFGFCWMNSSEELMHDDSTTAHNLASGIIFALYIVIVYCTSLVALLRTWNTFLKGLRDTFKTRQRIHRHLKYYVGCYFGYWTLVLACYALFSILPQEASSNGLRCHVWHFLSCLLLAKGTVNSLIWTRTSNILKVIEQLREMGYVDLPPQDDSINWALRLEILTNTTKGICESIARAERQARMSAASSSSSEDGSQGIPIDYCERKESYSQIEEIILENRNERSGRGPRSDGVVFYDYAPHVFRRLRIAAKVSSASYRSSLRQTTKERVSEGKSGAFFYFTEDRRFVVKTMTHEELKFLLSILPKYYTYITAQPNTFVTRFFGCHAITMYGKTVFFMVMQSVFDTTLQIHERFDLKGAWVGRLEGRKPTGTIATCKFCNVDFTVGGSHDQICDARRGEGNLRHQYDQVGKDLNWNRHMSLPRATARNVAKQLTCDSDFLCRINCIDYSLLVGIHHRSFNVSHYSSAESFEVGPRSSCCSFNAGRPSAGSFSGRQSGAPPGNVPGQVNAKPFHQEVHGGMSVDEVHGPGIYFTGLIDILQQWNMRKRIEHFVRVYILLQDRNGISVVNPRHYAERFQQRVIRELIYDSDAEVDDTTLMAQQLFLQEQHDLQMFESGRTLSTVLNSFDIGVDGHTLTERQTAPHLHMPPPLPIMVKKSRKRAATTATTVTGPPSPALIAAAASFSQSIPRFSGVFEPDLPMYASRRSSFQMVYPCQLGGCTDPTCCCGLTQQLRRPLAPLVPSPRPSGQSDVPPATSPADRHSSFHSITVASPQANSSATTATSIVIDARNDTPGSPNAYRIVHTPTFPSSDKQGSLSA
ncbi:TPA: hypothetical protein N0F65_006469 [Lagenidium giganteum]|uniref:PIPK domain-containing protein n=1 Tax=Lagenidium giganteum TaxID=4803 RepID=A0AAV2YAT4_9STRA|nr:TPA: hypothetical protein N0F65_006469 [Lagenidium giganteum]